MLLALAVVGVLLTVASHVLGHGRLMDPPARNSMWRLGFPNPVNYNDNELYCGGRITQWARNKGKCGVCGDAHHHTTKDHEVGGKYANGIISRQYTQGDAIEVTVHITANHKGYFEFRICPVTDPKVEVTQECLDQHVLEMINGEGTRYNLPEGKSNQFFNVSLRLPADVTCKQCVIQWKYRTGNTWDKDETGKFCVGCGPQEEFYNCADVTINAKDSKQVENPKQLANKDTENQKNTKSENAVKHTGQTIVFSDEAFKDKITDYGKQKVQFLKKLQEKKYSTWEESSKSITKADEEANSVAKTTDYSKPNTGSGMRFGYLGDDYTNFNFKVNASQPSGVTYKWKSDNLNNPDFEDVPSRFGLISSTKKKDNVDAWRHETSKNQVEQTEKNGYTYGESEKDIGRENEMNYKKDGEIQSQIKTDSHSRSVSEGSSPASEVLGSVPERATTPQPSLEKAGSEHNTLDKAVVKLRTQLREILHNAKINPQQRDGFLRRWKMLRLRQIAARNALSASNSFSSANSKPQLLPQSQTKISSNNHVGRDEDINVTPTLMRIKPSSRQEKEQSNGREIDVSNSHQNLSPAAKFAEARKIVKQSNSRQTYLKHKLPSWLVTTLKLKYQDGQEGSDSYNKQNNKGVVNSENGINKANINQHEEKSTRKWYNKKQRGIVSGFYKSQTHHHQDSNTIEVAHKRKDTASVDISKSQDKYENVAAQMLDRSVKTEDLEEKVDDNEESANLVDKNKESGITEDTESLVRYIVKLLLARKRGHALDKSNRKSVTSHFNLENIKTPEKLAVGSDLKNNGTDEFPRPVYASDENQYNLKKVAGNDQEQQYNLYPSRKDGASIFEFDDMTKSFKNEYPSVRAEVQPFNGLVLGSDLIYNQGQVSHNQGQTPHNQGQARHNQDQVTYNQGQVNHNHGQASHSEGHASYNQGQATYNQGYARHNQGQAKSTIQTNPNWEPAKTYTKEDMMNTQIKNLGFGRNDNHLQQQTSYDVNYDKPFKNVHYQKPTEQNTWFNSQMNPVPENPIDYHHIWSARALNRQGYYNNKQETTQSRLQCRSLVTLGGGMDQWCTDNCNANFCPPSMCVCMSSLPSSSVYASVGHSLPTHSSTNQRQQQIGGAMTNQGTSEGAYGNLGYIPEAGEYITADVSGQAQHTKFLPEHRDGSYIGSRDLIPAQALDHAMIGNAFRERKDSSSLHSINSIRSQGNHNRAPMRMHRSGNTDSNIDQSTYTNPFYSQYLGESPQHRHALIIDGGAGLGQRELQDSLRNDHGKGAHIAALPYTSNNIIQSNFQEYDSNPDLSVSNNWFPNTRPVLESQPQPSIMRENLMKPFVNYQNQRHNTVLSSNDVFSRSKAYTVPEVVGQSFVGQNQFYPQFTNMNNPNRQEVSPTPKCKAIGAYTGLKHFDEWCDSTCQSAMCPLLICSCDN